MMVVVVTVVMAIVMMTVVMPARIPPGLDPAPSPLGTHPTARRVDIVGPCRLPIPLIPRIGVLTVLPDPRDPHIADARRRDRLIARRGRCNGHHARHIDVDRDLRQRTQRRGG